MNASRGILPLVALGLLVPAAISTDPGDDLLAVVWVQTAAEYRALCRQVFVAAAARLDEAKGTPTWSAALEQIGADGLEKMPPAIVIDVDETVLDNSPYNARLIEDDETFAFGTWAGWVPAPCPRRG